MGQQSAARQCMTFVFLWLKNCRFMRWQLWQNCPSLEASRCRLKQPLFCRCWRKWRRCRDCFITLSIQSIFTVQKPLKRFGRKWTGMSKKCFVLMCAILTGNGVSKAFNLASGAFLARRMYMTRWQAGSNYCPKISLDYLTIWEPHWDPSWAYNPATLQSTKRM